MEFTIIDYDGDVRIGFNREEILATLDSLDKDDKANTNLLAFLRTLESLILQYREEH